MINISMEFSGLALLRTLKSL